MIAAGGLGVMTSCILIVFGDSRPVRSFLTVTELSIFFIARCASLGSSVAKTDTLRRFFVFPHEVAMLLVDIYERHVVESVAVLAGYELCFAHAPHTRATPGSFS